MLLNWAEVSGQMVITKKVRKLTGPGKRQVMINLLPRLGGTQHVHSSATGWRCGCYSWFMEQAHFARLYARHLT